VFRTTDIVLIAAMVAGAAFTYNTKHQVEVQLAEVRRLEAAIRFERDTMTVLKADWSLLTQPSRLQKLTEIYQDQLALVPLDAQQIVGIDELPAKPVDLENLGNPQLGGMASHDLDGTVTGGVTQ
jgi:hypothetical protein